MPTVVFGKGTTLKVRLKQTVMRVRLNPVPLGPKVRLKQTVMRARLAPSSIGTIKVGVPGLLGPVGPVGLRGPVGPVGPTFDPVCVVKPNATLTYVADILTRVDYADGRFKTLAYDGTGKLVTVACVDPAAPQTITKTLGYTGDLLTSVTTVVT